MTSRSASGKGNGRNKTPFTTLKMAVFAPMPSASVSTATAVKPGFFRNCRKANFKSFIAQSLHRIDSRRAACGQKAGGQRHEQKNRGYANEGQWISCLYFIKLVDKQACEGKRARETDGQANQRGQHSLSDNKREHVPTTG